MRKGQKLTQETKDKISKANKGRKRTPEQIEKIRISSTGRKHTEEFKKMIGLMNKGKKLSDETKKKIGLARAGKPGPNKGRKFGEETRKKMSEIAKTRVFSKETRKKMSINAKKNNIGERLPHPLGEEHPNWKGGISKFPYPFNWNETLKEGIRQRDNYECQECGIHQDELIGTMKKLHIHHIDYDKNNLNPDNLISLCQSCHSKTNYNREKWIEYFKNI